jgi:2-polyprenyl-3-methyl-5-hydroxy-6-metoxy-1,4-benzoquinol methylase
MERVHDMLPQTSHDEGARLDFVRTLRSHLSARIMPGNHAVYEARLKPSFEREHDRPPANRDEIRRLMNDEPYYQFWSALQRRSQELMWDSAIDPTERQLDALIDRFREYTDAPAGGSLRLDPALEIPRYHTCHDIHIMPGGYHTEFAEDDVAVGAIYDWGIQLYMADAWGPLGDFLGRVLLSHYQQNWPGAKPQRILDMGCAIGNSTGAWATAFPEAEIHAIDVGAPVLRYGHGRSEALGHTIHYSQQNAEATDFDAGSFDLVISHIMLHETSKKALPRILAESRRLLAPGGVMLHFDIPRGNTPFDQFMHDWESYNNNESFSRFMTDIDLVQTAVAAGWSESEVRIDMVAPKLDQSAKNYSEDDFAFTVLAGEL